MDDKSSRLFHNFQTARLGVVMKSGTQKPKTRGEITQGQVPKPDIQNIHGSKT